MRYFTHLALVALLLCCAASAEPPASRLEGLWEVVQVKDLTLGKVQPPRREFHMYTQSHEMIILAGENRKKVKKSLSQMTAEEVMTQQPIGAGFYRYEIVGDGKMKRTAVITLSAYYEGRTVDTEFDLDGDRLVVRDSHSADGHLREWTMRRVE